MGVNWQKFFGDEVRDSQNEAITAWPKMGVDTGYVQFASSVMYSAIAKEATEK